MTNPIEYLFKSLRSLHFETELLEVCGWDDNRASHVKNSFEKVVSEILSASEAHSRESLIAEIKKKMLDLISEKELDVCLHIINGMLDNPGQFKGADYEN